MENRSHNVLIIGGGVAGMTAAKVLDGFGVHVHLIEKTDHLGGKALDWACMATDTCQYCSACLCAELVNQMKLLDNAKVYLDSAVTGFKPIDSGYQVTIQNKRQTVIHVQAVLIATGLKIFDPSEVDFYEYNHAGVMTTAELNEIFKEERLKDILPETGSPRIAFIQCVGSRNRELGLDYCSQVCCKVAIRQATKVLHQIPNASITFFHIDLQNFGKIFRTQVGNIDHRIKMVQGIPARILPSTDQEGLAVIQEDPENKKRTALHFDKIILAVGMRADHDNLRLFKDMELPVDEWGFLMAENSSVGKGIYAIGTVTGPTDILTSCEQGKKAALNIIKGLDMEPPEPKKYTIAVIGGGRDGYKTAAAMVQEGYSVVLLDEDNHDAPDHEGITTFRKSRLTGVSGVFGDFHISAKNEGHKWDADVSAMIIASGSRKKPLSRDGFEPFENSVMTFSDFVQKYPNNHDQIPANITFLLDHEAPEWKANAGEVLSKAMTLQKQGKYVTIIMKKMLVNGLNGQRKYDQARKAGIQFLRAASSPRITAGKGKGTINIQIKETTLPPEITLDIPCDLLVVPEMIQPSPENKRLAGILGQMIDEEGFLQSPNTRHRLTGSPRRGVFFTGSCHDETDDQDLDLEIDSIKASLRSLFSGHIQADNPATIHEAKCARCLTCLRACPHGAIILRGQFQPIIVEEACFGCGVCVSACPSNAISQQDEKKGINSDHPMSKVVVFACERSAYLAEMSIKGEKAGYKEDVQVIPVRCASSLDIRSILDPFLKGAEKVLVAACHEGNCRSMVGTRLADTRIKLARRNTGITESELAFRTIAANEPEKMFQLIHLAKSGKAG
ncbi:MAG: FAD-dependent oxidoreductase [Deltaproteobacteria bacterium]|nr:FAD-dependent oxidoreductase [Deltaproteobacteria bacterium]